MTDLKSDEDTTVVVGADRWSRLNDWIGLAANVGVLLGLIALAVEISQYRNATRLQSEIDASRQQAEVWAMQTNPALATALVAASESPETLTAEQKYILDGFYAAVTQRANQLYAMYEGGFITKDKLRADLANEMPYALGSPYGRAWWEGERAGWGHSTKAEIMEELFQNLDPDFLRERYRTIDSALPARQSSMVE